jgi:NAD-dependent dihydropyrimidine dehydrogenase PreA subunit
MAIEKIDKEKCIGCGICVKACNMDVLRMGADGKPYVKYIDDCIVCMYCEEDCPTQAIFVSPVKQQPYLLSWG